MDVLTELTAFVGEAIAGPVLVDRASIVPPVGYVGSPFPLTYVDTQGAAREVFVCGFSEVGDPAAVVGGEA